MRFPSFRMAVFSMALLPIAAVAAPDGDGTVAISGGEHVWMPVTLSLDGPYASETGEPNPFMDYRMTVVFTHESGEPSHRVPGYFAADGDAANTSASEGCVWRAHLAPDKPGRWTYRVEFASGPGVSVSGEPGQALAPYDGTSGSFKVGKLDRKATGFYSKGRLEYVGQRYLRFAQTHEIFLKAGPDAPETFLGYVDFDGTETRKVPLKTWEPHVKDWQTGDPTWKKDGKGKGMIGALNYLASKGVNAFSFLTYNAGGDGDNVWPFVARDDKLHYDCSKLDQWNIVFTHAQRKGLFLHFKLQEQEIDDNRVGHDAKPGTVPVSLDGGALGPERKLYIRELVARYAHHLALNWNMSEETTQSPEEQLAMAGYFMEMDVYGHHRVIHTHPDHQEKYYEPLLGHPEYTGASLQNHWSDAHRRCLQWLDASKEAGQQWAVACDEQNPASAGAVPDPGYQEFSGTYSDKSGTYTMHDIRKGTLWGTLMAGGMGVEYYFGNNLPQSDMLAEDYRSRDRSWDYCRIALEFFRSLDVDLVDLENHDALLGASDLRSGPWCLDQPGEIYIVYLNDGGEVTLDLTGQAGSYSVRWFNPREGGKPQKGSVAKVQGGKVVKLGPPPADVDQDWAVILRKR